MLQVESESVRENLIEMLSKNKHSSSSEALVNRALFDFSPAIREKAIEQLMDRRREDYWSALIDGLRYPWPPIADHAAKAIITVGSGGSRIAAIRPLVELLDKPDPAAPYRNDDGQWIRREICGRKQGGTPWLPGPDSNQRPID